MLILHKLWRARSFDTPLPEVMRRPTVGGEVASSIAVTTTATSPMPPRMPACCAPRWFGWIATR